MPLTLRSTLFGLVTQLVVVWKASNPCYNVAQILRCWAIFKFTENHLSSNFQNVAFLWCLLCDLYCHVRFDFTQVAMLAVLRQGWLLLAQMMEACQPGTKQHRWRFYNIDCHDTIEGICTFYEPCVLITLLLNLYYS